MTEHKPSSRTTIFALASLLAAVLPAIFLSGMGYIWFIDHGLKLDMHAQPEGLEDRVWILAAVAPMLPVVLAAILIVGIPWMFLMSRLLSWPDIQYFTKQKGPRLPWISKWLDQLWLRMIESRKDSLSRSESNQ